MAGKIYTSDNKIISDGFPQIQILDKLYRVDTRMSNYEAVQEALPAVEKGGEVAHLLRGFLGEEAYAEIKELDLTFSGTMNLLYYVMAAVMDITFEAAEARFQRAGLNGF